MSRKGWLAVVQVWAGAFGGLLLAALCTEAVIRWGLVVVIIIGALVFIGVSISVYRTCK